MADATSAVSPLRRRMIDDMTLRNLSPATQRSYLHAVAKFSRHCHRSPQTSALSLGRTKSGDDTLYVLRRKEKSRITAEARRRSEPGGILGTDGKPEQRKVTTGLDNKIVVEITSGLKAGERVVTTRSSGGPDATRPTRARRSPFGF